MSRRCFASDAAKPVGKKSTGKMLIERSECEVCGGLGNLEKLYRMSKNGKENVKRVNPEESSIDT